LGPSLPVPSILIQYYIWENFRCVLNIVVGQVWAGLERLGQAGMGRRGQAGVWSKPSAWTGLGMPGH